MNSRNVLATVVSAILAYSTSCAAAVGQTGPAAERSLAGNGEYSPTLFSEAAVDQSPGAGRSASSSRPRWTASADFIILERVGSAAYTLVEIVPRSVPVQTPGTELLNATDLHQGFSGGWRLDLIHHGDNGGDLEFVYFQVDGWNVARSFGPTPNDYLVMEAPGSFLQFQNDIDTQTMTWDYGSRLYNAEVNARWNRWRRVTVLAGFRWVNLTENLEGILMPPTPYGTGPFWNTKLKNNLYGLQIGADAELLERGRLSIDSVLKAGIFDNHVEETTSVRMERIQFADSAVTDHAAFVGEVGLQCQYRVTPRLSLKAGYEAIWLRGVALAPGQISETYCWYGTPLPQDAYVRTLAVNCNSGVFYHGATAGLEYVF